MFCVNCGLTYVLVPTGKEFKASWIYDYYKFLSRLFLISLDFVSSVDRVDSRGKLVPAPVDQLAVERRPDKEYSVLS